MSTVLMSSSETRTGIRVVDHGDRIETFNILGELIHTIEWSHRGEGILVARWRGSSPEEEVKEIISHFLDVFIESKCTKVLLDMRAWSTSWDGINDWQREVIMPQAYRAGLERNAILIPGGEADMADLHEFAAERFAEEDARSASFTSEQAALAWLREAR